MFSYWSKQKVNDIADTTEYKLNSDRMPYIKINYSVKYFMQENISQYAASFRNHQTISIHL